MANIGHLGYAIIAAKPGEAHMLIDGGDAFLLDGEGNELWEGNLYDAVIQFCEYLGVTWEEA